MFFDTHCHLNFKTFNNNLNEVIDSAKKAGVNNILVPGTDVESSENAVEIAKKYEGIYAAVGIHPHHAIQYQKSNIKNQKYKSDIDNDLQEIEALLKSPKVVGVGEVGVDKHYYQKTKHEDYQITEEFIKLQKELFIRQIELAIKYKKTLIVHNREAKEEVLKIISDIQKSSGINRVVFHCCEPDDELLDFAKKHSIFVGVDGDITYRKDKQEFIKKIPLKLLVLETDSPFLTPRLSLARSHKRYNEPKNIPLITGFIAQLLDCSIDFLASQTTENAKKLFNLNNK